MKHNVFDAMVRELTNDLPLTDKHSINFDDYVKWRDTKVCFDILHNQRYGQSFVNRFGITDKILYYETSWINADEYIRKTYIKE